MCVPSPASDASIALGVGSATNDADRAKADSGNSTTSRLRTGCTVLRMVTKATMIKAVRLATGKRPRLMPPGASICA